MALFRWGKSPQRGDQKGPLSLAQARMEQGEVVLGDLHELKTSVGEARYENDFTNAQATFLRNEFEVVAAHLEEIKDAYANSQMRLLRRDSKGLPRRESRALADKQAQVRHLISRFDETIKALHLKADRQAQRRLSADGGGCSPLPHGFAQAFAAAPNADSREAELDRYFSAVPVSTTGDVKPATVYALRRDKSLTVLVTGDRFPTATLIPVSDALSGKLLKPLALQDFIILGKNGELVQLQPRQRDAGVEKGGVSSADGDLALRFTSLDLTDFNQLVLAADQCGIISSVPISNARDQHFRQEKYQHAFSAVERVYQEFVSKAGQRLARLREEEQAYRRGRLPMSPRQWQDKQRHDMAQTQCVERARKHFKLVMDGLRILHLQQQRAQS